MERERITPHDVIFTAWDCNDPDWDSVIEVLSRELPNFHVGYGDGHNMIFTWADVEKEV